jgi:hypothetical protein
MLDQIARVLCSPAWTSVLAALLILWWVIPVTAHLCSQFCLIATIGAHLIVESIAALLFTYVLLPLAPSRGMALARLATQLLAVPLTSYLLTRGNVQPWRKC